MSDTITNKPASQMLIALNALASGFNGRTAIGVYQGTVAPATKAKRRAAGKVARKARRASR
jgi:hypothetical protein